MQFLTLLSGRPAIFSLCDSKQIVYYSGPQYPHSQLGDDNTTYLIGLL